MPVVCTVPEIVRPVKFPVVGTTCWFADRVMSPLTTETVASPTTRLRAAIKVIVPDPEVDTFGEAASKLIEVDE